MTPAGELPRLQGRSVTSHWSSADICGWTHLYVAQLILWRMVYVKSASPCHQACNRLLLVYTCVRVRLCLGGRWEVEGQQRVTLTRKLEKIATQRALKLDGSSFPLTKSAARSHVCSGRREIAHHCGVVRLGLIPALVTRNT